MPEADRTPATTAADPSPPSPRPRAEVCTLLVEARVIQARLSDVAESVAADDVDDIDFQRVEDVAKDAAAMLGRLAEALAEVRKAAASGLAVSLSAVPAGGPSPVGHRPRPAGEGVTVAAAIDTDRFAAWRDAIRRQRRADARADVRDTSTPVLLADLADCRADLAQPLPPPWWLEAATRAGRLPAELRRRGEVA